MVRRKISVTIDEELLEWARKQVESKRFRSISHVIEYALTKLKEKSNEKRGLTPPS